MSELKALRDWCLLECATLELIAISEFRKENWVLYLHACCHAELWIHWLNLAWQFHPFVKLRVVSYLFWWAIREWPQLHARAIQRTRDVSWSLVRVRAFHRFFYFSHQDLRLLTVYSFNWNVNLPVAKSSTRGSTYLDKSRYNHHWKKW